jgi:hypothetical protein
MRCFRDSRFAGTADPAKRAPGTDTKSVKYNDKNPVSETPACPADDVARVIAERPATGAAEYAAVSSN